MHKTALSVLALTSLMLVCEDAAFAADETSTVFGMELQKPFVVPECRTRHFSKKLMEYWDPPTQGVCYRMLNSKDAGTPRPLNDLVDLRWPDNGSPQLVKANSATATIVDGNLEGVAFNTLGLLSQERDLTALKAKYGEPTQIATLSVMNGYGATFSPIRASWALGDIVVSLDGAQSQVTSGLIRVETLKSIAYRKSELDRLTHRGPSL